MNEKQKLKLSEIIKSVKAFKKELEATQTKFEVDTDPYEKLEEELELIDTALDSLEEI